MDTQNLFNEERPESRSHQFADLDVSSDGWSFEGILTPYDQDTNLGQGRTESFAHGAYRKALASGDNVPLVYHHQDSLPVLATTKGNTFSMKEDGKYVRVKGSIAQHYVGEAVRELMKRGDITGMSPGFIVGRGNAKIEQRAGALHRTILSLKKIIDASLTWDPAYPTTTAELRSLRMADQTLRASADHMDPDELIKAIAALVAGQIGGSVALGTPVPAPVETSQQVDGGAHQQPVDGADEDPVADAGTDEKDPEVVTDDQPEEQRSGVDSSHEAEAAARMRRLQMLGLSLPR